MYENLFFCNEMTNKQTTHVMKGGHRRPWASAIIERPPMRCRSFGTLFTRLLKNSQSWRKGNTSRGTISQFALSKKEWMWCPRSLRHQWCVNELYFSRCDNGNMTVVSIRRVSLNTPHYTKGRIVSPETKSLRTVCKFGIVDNPNIPASDGVKRGKLAS